jgi:hypothetical protein
MTTGDMISIFLGCDHPILLRPRGNEFEVVGICNAHDLCDTTALLGPLPEPWMVEFSYSDTINAPMPQPHYVNTATREKTREDPRLGAIPQNWERISSEWTNTHPRHVDYFQDRDTDQIISSDPRLYPEALQSRGIVLDYVHLV